MYISFKNGLEFNLHLCNSIYPILSTYVFFGQELIELITKGTQVISKDGVSILLYIVLCVSIICSLVILYLVRISMKQRCLKKFTRYFLSHYILMIFSYCTFAIKYSRAERTKICHASIDIVKYLHFWLLTIQFVIMVDFMEILRKEKGYPAKTKLLGVRVEKLFLVQIILAWCALPHAAFLLQAGFYSKKLEALFKSGRLITSLSFTMGTIASFFVGINSLTLYKGVNMESLDWIRFHYAFKLFVYIFYTFPSYFHDRMLRLYVPSTRNAPFWHKFDLLCGRLAFLFELWAIVIYQHLLKRRKEYRDCESANSIIPHELKEIKEVNLDMKTKRLIEKAHISEWKISLDEAQKLGEGTYAKVFRGHLRSGTFSLKALPVAIKILKETGPADGDYTKALVSEIKSLLLSKNHPSLVDIYGLTRYKEKPGVVMEYCTHGSLDLFLQKERNQEKILDNLKEACPNQLDHWALQIANGLEFLEKMNIVHGDLAARNVLLDSYKNAKISDFGMSIRLYNYQLYAISSSFSVFPWRWMAPESLCDMKFSTQSDIWSYGVTLWEIYSFGLIPWENFDWTSDFIGIVKQGKILDKPCHASDEMYESIMCQCWRVQENERIEIKEIVSYLQGNQQI